jgi:transposase
MKMFPGNESEKPVIREVIDDLKKQNNITGKTIQVADKGLNCSENIITALKNGDGYIFSKSVKQLSEKEMVWVELDRDWHEVKNKEGKLLYKYKECVDAFPYTYAGENGKTLKVKIKEKRVLTYNPSLAEKQKFEIRKMAEKVKDLCYSKAKRAEYGDYGKYVTFKGKSSGELAIATVNQEAIDNDLRYVGLNMIVTSEVSMSAADIYSTYHNLWRIEESFRIMKSDLDARPVFLQKENTIKGHFLICYIAVLLERILQFRILGNKHCSSEIYQFFKDFIIVKGENRSINLTSKTDFIAALAKETDLPLLNLNLTDSQVKKIMNWSV